MKILLLAIIALLVIVPKSTGFHFAPVSVRSSLRSRRCCAASMTASSAKGDESMLDKAKSFFSDAVGRVFRQPSSEPVVERISTRSSKVCIVGAGISGLACAQELLKAGFTDLAIIESSDGPGGRVRTDKVDGFLLDRGFQVFIDSYPEARELFDYSALDLQPFLPGAIVRFDNSFHLVSDPLRRPQDLIPSLISPIGTLGDKIKVGLKSISSRFDTVENIFANEETNTLKYLSDLQGLSPAIVDRFFKPFFQGIFLSPLETQSSRMFEFVFKMFADGSATLPRQGMGKAAEQLASKVQKDKIAYNTRVVEVAKPDGKRVSLLAKNAVTGESIRYECDKLVLATDPRTTRALLATGRSPEFSVLEKSVNPDEDVRSLVRAGASAGAAGTASPIIADVAIPPARSSICLYFAIDGEPPVTDPILVLNGEEGNDLSSKNNRKNEYVINNVCFPSQVSRDYAPEGKSLASVTIVGSPGPSGSLGVAESVLEQSVRKQLEAFWPEAKVSDWKLLKIYRIPYAQPAQLPPYEVNKPPFVSEGVYVCGDHFGTATLNGAIASGRRAASEVLKSLQ